MPQRGAGGTAPRIIVTKCSSAGVYPEVNTSNLEAAIGFVFSSLLVDGELMDKKTLGYDVKHRAGRAVLDG